MKKIAIIIVYLISTFLVTCFLLSVTGCALKQKQSFVIGPPPPRTIIVPADSTVDETNSVDYFNARYPDSRRGCIINRAHPYRPKIWYIKQGSKIALVGPNQERLPPEFLAGEIREFCFSSFGIHVFHIERWYRFGEEWKKVGKVEVVELNIKEFVNWDSSSDPYGWRIIIHQKYSEAYDKN